MNPLADLIDREVRRVWMTGAALAGSIVAFVFLSVVLAPIGYLVVLAVPWLIEWAADWPRISARRALVATLAMAGLLVLPLSVRSVPPGFHDMVLYITAAIATACGIASTWMTLRWRDPSRLVAAARLRRRSALDDRASDPLRAMIANQMASTVRVIETWRGHHLECWALDWGVALLGVWAALGTDRWSLAPVFAAAALALMLMHLPSRRTLDAALARSTEP